MGFLFSLFWFLSKEFLQPVFSKSDHAPRAKLSKLGALLGSCSVSVWVRCKRKCSLRVSVFRCQKPSTKARILHPFHTGPRVTRVVLEQACSSPPTPSWCRLDLFQLLPHPELQFHSTYIHKVEQTAANKCKNVNNQQHFSRHHVLCQPTASMCHS